MLDINFGSNFRYCFEQHLSIRSICSRLELEIVSDPISRVTFISDCVRIERNFYTFLRYLFE